MRRGRRKGRPAPALDLSEPFPLVSTPPRKRCRLPSGSVEDFWVVQPRRPGTHQLIHGAAHYPWAAPAPGVSAVSHKGKSPRSRTCVGPPRRPAGTRQHQVPAQPRLTRPLSLVGKRHRCVVCERPSARAASAGWPQPSRHPAVDPSATATRRRTGAVSRLYCKLGQRTVDHTQDPGRGPGRGGGGARGGRERVQAKGGGLEGKTLARDEGGSPNLSLQGARSSQTPGGGQAGSLRQRGGTGGRVLRGEGVWWAGLRVWLSGRSPPPPPSSHPAGKPRRPGRSW